MIKGSPSAKKHRERGPKSVSVAVTTVSDSRTEETDESGALIREALTDNGHKIVRYSVCPDDSSRILMELEAALDMRCDVIVFNGGTGLAPRDATVETIGPCLEKRLEGFGELFRQLSYREIGSAAMLSRAVAGTCKGAMVFCLPGSPEAVKLAMSNLILPELGHMVGLVKGHAPHH